jgi:hypothetical protein
MTTIQAKNVNHPDHRENLKAEKYNWIRQAMLAVLPPPESRNGMPFAELEKRVGAYLEENEAPGELFPKPGSVRWYTKAVQLDLEARDEIERLPNRSPIRLRKRGAA